jgi:LemA protein
MIPNIVETVKASAKFEQDTLTKVMEARSSATQIKLSGDDFSDPRKMEAFQRAQDQLRGSLSRLMMVEEKYPELQASQAFHSLQVEVEGTENRILRAREEYNAAVKEYNATLGKVGGQVTNKVSGKSFQPRVYFTTAAESRAVPVMKF